MSRLTALLARIAPAPLARLAAQLRGDLAVSVVVHADDDSIWFLGECLAALARQRRRPRQVLAVVTATPDLAQALLEPVRSRRRLQVLTLPGAGRGAGFAAGVAASRYQRVLLLDAGERLRPDGLARLHAEHADLVGGPGPVPTVPVLWRVSALPAGSLDCADGPWRTFQPQADALLAGATAASLPEPVLAGPVKGTGQGFTNVPILAPHVLEFVDHARRAARIPGADQWLLRNEIPRYLRDAERCGRTQREALTTLIDELCPDLMAIPVEDRVRIALAQQDRWEELVAFNTTRWRQRSFPVRVDGGRSYAILPVEVPPGLLLVAPQPPRPRLAEQLLLQQRHREAEVEVDPGLVLFQSYQGAVTDSPAAVERVLARVRPDLRRAYVVAAGQQAPEGCAGVVVRTPEWYHALATAGAIVTNIDLEPWFRKRPGQRVLQTYHGMPSKTMGIAAWRAKGWTDSLIEKELGRTSGTWDLLVTATPEMERHYREQYRHDGPVLAAGYPRDDDLVTGDLDRRRTEVRARLGIGERTAVLYAPTWRDDLASATHDVPMPDLLNLPWTARELGAEFVLLVRGHRFHRSSNSAGNILDVTGYPEINDLILAGDAAVLDYSSLRFDFSLTGRPMVFLVPDLGRYSGSARGFLFPFTDSAPGPLVSTPAQVVAALRDLPGLRSEYAPAYEKFARRFNSHQDGHAAERVVATFFG